MSLVRSHVKKQRSEDAGQVLMDKVYTVQFILSSVIIGVKRTCDDQPNMWWQC